MTTPVFDEAFWNDLYGDAPLWSGSPNPHLVSVAAPLAAAGSPGSALDVGSGEGGDAIWLAQQGWQVTAVDLSTVALKRAQDSSAHDPESAARISWQHVDLLQWTPPHEAFDLVSSQYMHLPTDQMQGLVTALAAAVRSGGTLLVVGHSGDDHHPHPAPPGAADPAAHGAPGAHGTARAHQEPNRPEFTSELFFTAESLAELLDPATWEIVSAGPRPHPTRPGTDAVLHARRR